MNPDDQLFDTTAYEQTPVVTPDMGHDAARTARKRALIERGIHPATLLPLLQGDRIHGSRLCEDCAHLWHKNTGNWSGWKCRQASTTGTDGPDMTKSWPACSAFKPLEGGGE